MLWGDTEISLFGDKKKSYSILKFVKIDLMFWMGR